MKTENEVLQAIAAGLRKKGYLAHVEHPGAIWVTGRGKSLIAGFANVTLGWDLLLKNGEYAAHGHSRLRPAAPMDKLSAWLEKDLVKYQIKPTRHGLPRPPRKQTITRKEVCV